MHEAITHEAVHPERMSYRFMIWRDCAVLANLPRQILHVPRGCIELAVSPLAALFGRYRFKQFALRGGFQLSGREKALLAQPFDEDFFNH